MLARSAHAIAMAAFSLPPLCKHACARGPCAAGHGRLPPRVGARFALPLLTCRVRDVARALPCTGRTCRQVLLYSSGGRICPALTTHASTLRLGPGSSTSPSHRKAPRSRYAPSIATPGTAPVDSPRLHSRRTTACCHHHFGVVSRSGFLSGSVYGDIGPCFVALWVGRADSRLERTSLSLSFVDVGTLR